MGKKLFLFIFVGVAYLLYARFVLSPQLYKNFSLIDDGRSIDHGYYVRECLTFHGCRDFKTKVLDAEAGTSRAAYWIIQGVLYQGPGLNAQFQHELRIYGIGLLLVFLFTLSATSAGANAMAVILGAAIFVTNYSFSENLIRLGPVEPYLVVFLGAFSLIFLNLARIQKRQKLFAFFIMAFTLFFLLLLKEVSVVVLPVMLFVGIVFSKIVQKKILIPTVIIFGLVFIAAKRLLSGTGVVASYVSEYNLNLHFIVQNAPMFLNLMAISLRPFFKLLVVTVPLILIFKKLRQNILDPHFIYWFLIFVSFTVILFPWRYILDRYLLPAIFAFSVVISLIISRLFVQLKELPLFWGNRKILLYLVVFTGLINLFFWGAPINFARTINYRNWFAVFTQFEADQVNAIAKNKTDTVYINAKDIPENWETVFDIPIYLQQFHNNIPITARLGSVVPSRGYLFSRTSLEPIIPLETLSKSRYPLLESKTYDVSQIDPLLFRQYFLSKPIQTLLNLPLLQDGFHYYWEIRKL